MFWWVNAACHTLCLQKHIHAKCEEKKRQTASKEEMITWLSYKPYGVFCHHLNIVELWRRVCLYDCDVQTSVSKQLSDGKRVSKPATHIQCLPLGNTHITTSSQKYWNSVSLLWAMFYFFPLSSPLCNSNTTI